MEKDKGSGVAATSRHAAENASGKHFVAHSACSQT
jgi:hypothetical protein